MSLTPFFLNGANALIKVSGVTMAFCTDFAYSIKVKHATPKVLGMFESFTIEPLAYDVTGSFRIIKYTKNLSEYLKQGTVITPSETQKAEDDLKYGRHLTRHHQNLIEVPTGVEAAGNGLGAWNINNTKHKANEKALNSVAGSSMVNGRADQSLDPSKLYWPQFFDVELFQKAKTSVSTAMDQGMVARIRNCRITGTDFVMTKRGTGVQTFTFAACYADEDTFLASESGVGQPST